VRQRTRQRRRRGGIEDIDFAPKRELDRAAVRQLGTCNWIALHANVIITGAAGPGKSYVACALAQQASRSGYRVSYRRMPRLIEELALAHADGTYSRLLGRLAKVDVLVLDDWGIAPLRDQERRDMLEIVEDRHGARATIVTSQLPVENWHDYVGDPTIADALLDRVVHTAHRIKLKGPTRRKPSG
jgi:DNA replication protein DnaC